MKNDWLSKFIFDTKLIEVNYLNEPERISLTSYLKDKKTLDVIAQELELSDERIRQVIENGMGKIFLLIKELLSKNKYLQSLQIENQRLEFELNELNSKFKDELEKEKTLTLKVKSPDISIDDILLSHRAHRTLMILKIKSIKDLKTVTKTTLATVPGNGVKTIEEIIRVAAEYGIKIN
ncbi:MAG: hypothetical protein EPN92_04080 [Chitinophagaceae bacterium]|nr:MAG: hypothetical protein EPN92_04080 [Chitinophagaceae bacterium]